MPLALVLLIVLCIGLLVTFNTGQITGKKVEITNAADAAAYSIAVEQARARNLAAYLNRGRVANEVAVAQMVSLNSWVTMVHSTSANFQDITKWAKFIPYIGPVIGAIDKALQVVNRALKVLRKNVLIPGFKGAIYTLDQVLNRMYATTAQVVLSDAASEVNLHAMVGKVVEDNAPDSKVSVAGRAVLTLNALQANRDLTLFNPGQTDGLRRTNNGGERYRNVVMASRDDFSRDRRTSLGPLGSNGGTDLVEYDRWSGVDVHEFRLNLLFTTIKIPLGWGGTQAVDQRQPRFFAGMNNGRGWRSPYDNRTYRAYNGVTSRDIAGRLIENDPASKDQGFQKREAFFTQYKYGITHRYYDVKEPTAGERVGYAELPEGDKAGPTFTVEVATGVRNARSSSAIGVGAGRMALKDEARGGELRAMASAQVYFNRPHEYGPFRRSVWGRGDGKFEQGSMFSPYWQARLVETPASDKLKLLAGP
jgi:Flp pilus assembly protein TadG